MTDSRVPILDDVELKSSINSFFGKTNIYSHTIYLIILGLLILASVAMAVFKIPVFVQSRGIIRPSAELKQILAPVQGVITKINGAENQSVNQGDTILQLDAEKEKIQKKLIVKNIEQLKMQIIDLVQLTDSVNKFPLPVSGMYQVEYSLYQEKLKEIDLRTKMELADYERYITLFTEKYLSKREFEVSVLKYKTLQNEKKQLIYNQQNRWINERNEYILQESAMLKSLSEIDYFIENSVIKAPVSGILQGIRNRFLGEFCATGTALFKLIPDTNLMAELQIPPRDIGFIHPGQKVRLLVDSYDYKYWGILDATCASVSNDIEITGNQALFRVICELNKPTFLEYLGNRVYPGKGMTLTAQFFVTERTIWQLLRDEAYNGIAENKN